MDKNERIIIFLMILTTIFTIVGGTFAYWSWFGDENQKTSVAFTVTPDFSCSADMGGGINQSNVSLKPTTVRAETVGNYIKRTMTVNAITSGRTIYMDLWLDVNSIDSGLSNSQYFKYALTTSNTSPTTDVVASGNFNGKAANDKVNLLIEKDYNVTTTDTYYLWIWLDAAETSTDTMNQSFDLSLNGSCYDQIFTGADMLVSKANPSTLSYNSATTAEKGEMWTFSHKTTEQVPATIDYRYIGRTPNNYITFNEEVWRIIGVFDGKIKIIRNETIGNMAWDIKQNWVGSSISDNGSNDWSDSQLMYMLNPTSYTLKSDYVLDGDYIRDIDGNIIYQLGCEPSYASGDDFYCTENTWYLSNTALSQVATTTYYLGGSESNSDINADDYYNLERGIDLYSGSDRPTSWTGQVALMYPSDYAYTYAQGVDDACFNDITSCGGVNGDSWLYKVAFQWLLSPNSDAADSAIILHNLGYVYNDSSQCKVNIVFEVAPVVYLKSDIKLQGSGTSSEPYEIVG